MPLITLLLAALFLSACVGPPLPLAGSPGDVLPGETVVVGRIEIVPPLDEGEQKMETVSTDRGVILVNPTASKYRNTVILVTDGVMREMGEPRIGDYRGRMEVPLSETFYVRVPGGPRYVLATEILMQLQATGLEKFRLPAGYKIDIRPGDTAVYMGTVRYHRNDFYDITKVEIVDEYRSELAAFRKAFGKKAGLRKALIIPQ
jgi:hypothetical protein